MLMALRSIHQMREKLKSGGHGDAPIRRVNRLQRPGALVGHYKFIIHHKKCGSQCKGGREFLWQNDPIVG